MPRSARSRAMPAPVAPPPMIKHFRLQIHKYSAA